MKHPFQARPEAPLPKPRLVPTGERPNAVAEIDPMTQPGVYLGSSVWWDPQGLPNPHLLVIGASGSGKTTLLKTLIWELSQQHQVIVIDFHGDQSVPGEQVYPLHMQSPYGVNPLILNQDPQGGGPSLQALQVAATLKRALRMGDIQEGLLIQLLKECYAERGILQEDLNTWDLPPPTFRDLEDLLREQAEDQLRGDANHKRLLNKLAATFERGIFSKPQPSLVEYPLNRIDLCKLPPEIQTIAAESLALQLMNEHRLLGEAQGLRTVLVVDEAKELIKGSALPRIFMDGRKYGLGMVIASQSEEHLHKDVIRNAASQIVMRVAETEVLKVGRKFRFDTERIAQLQRGQALCRLGSEAHFVEILALHNRPWVTSPTEEVNGC